MPQQTDTVPTEPLGTVAHQAMHSASISQLDTAHLKSYLRSLGAVTYNLLLPETRALPYVLQPGEQLLGIVYGRYRVLNSGLVGRGAFIATDSRVLLIDKKPLFIKHEEVIYDAVSGITYARVGFTGTIVLHTKLGDVKLRTFNQNCARQFVEVVEAYLYSGHPVRQVL